MNEFNNKYYIYIYIYIINNIIKVLYYTIIYMKVFNIY